MKQIIDYFKNSLGVDANTTATIFVTLLIFCLGYFITGFFNKINSVLSKRSYRRSVKIMLLNFQRACQLQAKTINASLDHFGLSEGKSLTMNYATLSPVFYLGELEMKTFIENFRRWFAGKKFSKAVSKLFSLIYQIKSLNQDIGGSLEKFNQSLQEYQDEYFINLNAIRKLHDEQLYKLRKEEMKDEETKKFIFNLALIFTEWQQKNPSTNIYVTHENVVERCLAHFQKFPFLPISHQLNDYALLANKAYLNIFTIENVLSEKFKSFSLQHRKASMLLEVIIKILY